MGVVMRMRSLIYLEVSRDSVLHFFEYYYYYSGAFGRIERR